jgi:hypothetical protein
MPLRDLEYNTFSYLKQYEKIKEKYPKKKGLSGNEFLSHMKKTDKLLPVITVVIYYGEEEWDGAKSLYEMMEIPAELRPFVNDYKMNLIEVRNAKLLFHNKNNKDLFRLFQIMYDKNKAGKEKKQEAIEYADANKVDKTVLLAVGSTSGVDMEVLEKEDADMCTLFEEIKKEGEEIGVEKGRVKEIVALCRELDMDDDGIIRKIEERLDIDADKAREYFEKFSR